MVAKALRSTAGRQIFTAMLFKAFTPSREISCLFRQRMPMPSMRITGRMVCKAEYRWPCMGIPRFFLSFVYLLGVYLVIYAISQAGIIKHAVFVLGIINHFQMNEEASGTKTQLAEVFVPSSRPPIEMDSNGDLFPFVLQVIGIASH